MADMHEVFFEWPHPEPSDVIVTGTFDQWSSSIHLAKGPKGFHGFARVPWEEKIAYKFIVDGQWIVHENQPTEPDRDGNINNVYTAPSRPPTSGVPPATLLPDVIEPTSQAANSPLNGTADSSIAVAAPERGSEGSDLQVVTPLVGAVSDTVISDVANVSEQVGDIDIMDSVAGVDSRQIEAPAPKPEDKPPTDETASPPIPKTTHCPVKPMAIVPVNAPENNTQLVTKARLPNPETPQGDATSALISTEISVSSVSMELKAPPSFQDHEERHTHIILPSSLPVAAAPADDKTKATSDATPVSDITSVEVIPAPLIADLGAASELTSPTSPEAAAPDVVGKVASAFTPDVSAADVVPIAELSPEHIIPIKDVNEAPTESTSTHVPETSSAGASGPKVEEAVTVPSAPEEQAILATTAAPVSLPDIVPSEDKPAPAASPTAPVEEAIEQANIQAPTVEEKAHSNGRVTPSASTEKPDSSPSTLTPSAPSTPPKTKQPFPSSSDSPSSSPNSSPLSSRTSTAASRKKRTSIFGRLSLRHIFGHDKEKEKEKDQDRK